VRNSSSSSIATRLVHQIGLARCARHSDATPLLVSSTGRPAAALGRDHVSRRPATRPPGVPPRSASGSRPWRPTVRSSHPLRAPTLPLPPPADESGEGRLHQRAAMPRRACSCWVTANWVIGIPSWVCAASSSACTRRHASFPYA
jgi:hypothetical protein